MIEGETIAGRVALTFSDGVAEVRLERPDKLNALDPGDVRGARRGGRTAEATAGLRAVVLHGAGRGFSAGLDMGSFAAIAAGRRDGLLADLAARTHGIANLAQQAAFVWREVPVPVIAAVHGVAFGGGFQIALGADVRYVAPDARLCDSRDQVGPRARHGRDRADAGAGARRRDPRARLHRAAVLRRGGGPLRLRHRRPRRPARTRRGRTAREIAQKSPDAVQGAEAPAQRLCRPRHGRRSSSAESREQAKIIGAPNQIEAIRAGVERRPPRFADPE